MEQIFIKVIESSSNGNCIVLDDSKTSILLDFGCSYSTFENALVKYGLDLEKIQAILLTHSHVDHIRTIESKYDYFNFYGTHDTINFVESKYNKKLNKEYVDSFSKKWIKIPNTDWQIKTYPTIHNCSSSICYLIKNKKINILYLTDTKYFYNRKFKNLDAYIIESPFGIEYSLDNQLKNKINLETEQNHLKLHETEKLFHLYTSKKTSLFLFSHLNPKTNDFSIIQNTCDNLSNIKKINVNFIKPNIKDRQIFIIEK